MAPGEIARGGLVGPTGEGRPAFASDCSTAKAECVNQAVKCDVDLAADRFWLRDDSGDDCQVRLEPDGRVYLCYTANSRRTIESRTVSWPDFVAAFRGFVDSIDSQ